MLNQLAELREERAEGEKGFTLIELLVVVVIIGVLVAIAIPLYLNYRTGAQNRSAQSDVRNAVSAVESCIGDNAGRAPTGAAIKSSGGAVYVTCTTAATSGEATLTKPTTGTWQTINVSDGVTLQYDFVSGAKYSIAAFYGSAGDGHRKFTYTSADGKTANVAS